MAWVRLGWAVVAGIPVIIAILVGLVGVGDVPAVVAIVTVPVAVLVLLVFVGNLRAVVADIALTVAVHVVLLGVGDALAVIASERAGGRGQSVRVIDGDSAVVVGHPTVTHEPVFIEVHPCDGVLASKREIVDVVVGVWVWIPEIVDVAHADGIIEIDRNLIDLVDDIAVQVLGQAVETPFIVGVDRSGCEKKRGDQPSVHD